MSWIYLFIASILEIGWPLGLKMADFSSQKSLWILFSVSTMILSGFFLYLAQKEIPIGTAYAIWTGIGASCTFILGILFFNDSCSTLRALGILFIILDILCLKFGH